MTTTTELVARFTSVQSHYRKAFVIHDNNEIRLQSYNTIVARCNMDGTGLVVYGRHSNTTTRHICDFINQFTNESVKCSYKDFERFYPQSL